jgi:hypothetical protein
MTTELNFEYVTKKLDFENMSKEDIIKEYNKLQQNYDILDAQCRGLYNNVLMHARSTTSLFNSLNIFDSHNMRIEIIEGKGD